MVERKNKNDVPLEAQKDLESEFNYTEFMHKSAFFHLCNIRPNPEREELIVEDIGHDYLNESGLVYVLVSEGKIVKIGHTINNIHSRISSYNCGKKKHREKGTCSTTNYFILQSILNIGNLIQVYAYFPEKQKYEIFDETGYETFPSPKVVERKVIKDFLDKYKRLPIGCTQR